MRNPERGLPNPLNLVQQNAPSNGASIEVDPHSRNLETVFIDTRKCLLSGFYEYRLRSEKPEARIPR